MPNNGELWREQGRAEIHWIRDGERVWIPNPYVLRALGLDGQTVNEVPPGGLDAIPVDTSWLPLGDGTPGSTVFVSTKFPLDPGGWRGRVYWPQDLATSKVHHAWGEEVRTIELRGWIADDVPNGINTKDPDVSWNLVPDVAWTLARGIDLNRLIRVGNILMNPTSSTDNPQAWCVTPAVHMEISGWPPKAQRDREEPPGWSDFGHMDTLNLKPGDADFAKFNGHSIKWPFDPLKPDANAGPMTGGEYVCVFGSICSDVAHWDLHPSPDQLAHNDAVGLWHNDARNNWDDDQARWTEMHPPDVIKVLWSPTPNAVDSHGFVPPAQTLRGVAVVAPGHWFGGNATNSLDTTIMAPPRPSATAVLRCREFVGPESTLGDWIVVGNADKTGALITPLPAGDGIRIQIEVQGAAVAGGVGKFRALYWLYWDEPQVALPPPGAQAVAPIVSLLLLEPL